MDSTYVIQNLHEQTVKQASLHVPHPDPNCLSQNGETILREFAAPCSPQSVCVLSSQATRPCWMTGAMGKQYVYSQHQRMACAVVGIAPVENQLMIHACPQGLLINWTPALALPFLSTLLEHFVCRQCSLAPRQLLFCHTLSTWRESSLPWIPICSQIPQKHLYSK